MDPIKIDYVDLFWKPVTKSLENILNHENDVALHALYQIYGYYLTISNNSLLYIGQSTNFPNRFVEHKNWLQYEMNTQFFYATLTGDDIVFLEEVEKLLIFSQSPPYNSQNLNWVSNSFTNKNLVVRNYGQKGVLVPEISVAYWEQFYKIGGWGKKELP